MLMGSVAKRRTRRTRTDRRAGRTRTGVLDAPAPLTGGNRDGMRLVPAGKSPPPS